MSRKYNQAQQRLRERVEEDKDDLDNDGEGDGLPETYQEDIEDEVFLDHGKMTRTNSNRRRPPTGVTVGQSTTV